MPKRAVDLDADFTRRRNQSGQIVEQIHLLGGVLDQRPQLAVLVQEVIVEIDTQQSGGSCQTNVAGGTKRNTRLA